MDRDWPIEEKVLSSLGFRKSIRLGFETGP